MMGQFSIPPVFQACPKAGVFDTLSTTWRVLFPNISKESKEIRRQFLFRNVEAARSIRVRSTQNSNKNKQKQNFPAIFKMV